MSDDHTPHIVLTTEGRFDHYCFADDQAECPVCHQTTGSSVPRRPAPDGSPSDTLKAKLADVLKGASQSGDLLITDENRGDVLHYVMAAIAEHERAALRAPAGDHDRELRLLAMLAADEPMFTNPLHIVAAKAIRDRVLREGASHE